MVSAEPMNPASTDPRSLLAAAFNRDVPLDSLNFFALAHLLKMDSVQAALSAREHIRDSRLRDQLAEATSRAVSILSTLCDSEDATEQRRAATALTVLSARLSNPHRSSARSLKDHAGAAPAPPRASASSSGAPPIPDRDPIPERPDPSPFHPEFPPTTDTPLPFPLCDVTPADVVRAQLLSLRFSRTPRAVWHQLYNTLNFPIRCSQRISGPLLKSLLASPAWTHRHLPFTLSDPIIRGNNEFANIRISFHDPSPSHDPHDPNTAATPDPPSCVFHLTRNDARGHTPWLLAAITDSSDPPRFLDDESPYGFPNTAGDDDDSS